MCLGWVLYLVKKITGSVGGAPFGYESSERHAVEHFGKEVTLDQASLAQEGRLRGSWVKSFNITGTAGQNEQDRELM